MIKSLTKKILEITGLLQPFKKLLRPTPIKLKGIITCAEANQHFQSGIKHVVVHSKVEYDKYISEYANELNERTAIENRLLHTVGKSFLLRAKNFILNRETDYQIRFRRNNDGTIESNLRETCVCLDTGLNSRIRATLYVLLNNIDAVDLHNKKFYLTEAVTDLFKLLYSKYPQVEGSEYLGNNIKSGTIKNGIRHEDITKMSYANAQFDVGICLEVLEHIPDYKTAFSELARITKEGGEFLITVPFLENTNDTIIRAIVKQDGSIEHLLPPEYHGDPVNADGGILCFQHFGWDIADDLKHAGFREVKFHFVWSLEEVMLGRHLLVIETIR